LVLFGKINHTTMKSLLIFPALLLSITLIQAQNVGIGTTSPDYRLQVTNAGSNVLKVDNSTPLGTDVTTDVMFKTGTYYTASIKSIGTATAYARLGFFTYASFGLPGSLKERLSITDDGNVGIGITAPEYLLDVKGDTYVTARFDNASTDAGSLGIFANCTSTAGIGTGVSAQGGKNGVEAHATKPGTGNRYGVSAFGQSGSGDNYGVYANGYGGVNAYGIYAIAFGGATNYAAYFNGNTYCTGAYYPSDRKLKDNIQPLSGALGIISRLNPAAYTYKTNEYDQLHLPQGLQYGLIADELQQVIPGAVQKAVQPAQYENNDQQGRKISDSVSFNAVNYTAIIPVLVAGMQEQNQLIEKLQREIEVLKAALRNDN
jgi:hypothetical protein